MTTLNAVVPRGFRHPSGSIRKAGGLERAIQTIAIKHPYHAILVVIDCDDDCPAVLGVELQARAHIARPDLITSVVLAHREYETWFLAAAESLAGKRRLPAELIAPLGLSSLFDLDVARTRSRSFRKLWKEIESMLFLAATHSPT